MRTGNEEYAAPSTRFYVLMAAMGGLVGVTLSLLQVPFWCFYVVPPIVMAPPLIRELHALGAREAARRDG